MPVPDRLAVACALLVWGAACVDGERETGAGERARDTFEASDGVGASGAHEPAARAALDVRADDGGAKGWVTRGAGCEAPCAHGRVVRDQRRVDAAMKRLGPVETVPVVDVRVTVGRRGAVMGEARTDGDGRFRIPLRSGLGPGLELIIVAAEHEAAAEGTDAPGEGLTLAVFDSVGVGVPRNPGEVVTVSRPWAWVVTPVAAEGDAIDFGQVYIDEAAGAGALALFEQIRALRARVGALFEPARLTSLAVMWSPARVPECLSCYLPSGWGPVVWGTARGEVRFERAVFFSGADSAPHHFTPSLIAHELGHWVLDLVSRHPEVGGGHGWDQLVAPPLAWAEGFATFFAQWSQSTAEAPVSRFFAIQSHVQYWVDLEGVGRGVSADDSSAGIVFPMPDAALGIAQPLNEAVVAAMLWDLWDGPGRVEDEPVALGDAALEAVAADRMRQLDRGAREPDLVDYLDALACEGVIDGVDPGPALLGFPWDAAPICR